METVSLLTLDMRMEERETDLDVAVSSYEHEKNIVINTLITIGNTKNYVIESLNSSLSEKLERCEYKQKYLYSQLKWLGSKIAYFEINRLIINNNDKIVKNLKSVIDSMESLSVSYNDTLGSLERLREYLINNCGTSGYVALNDEMGFLPQARSNLELVKSADRSRTETDNDKKRSALLRLVEYIKVDNDFFDEIKKVELMIEKYKRLKARLLNDIEYRKNELERTLPKTDGNREQNRRLKFDIANLRIKIENELNKGENLGFYEREIKKRKNEIDKEKKNIEKFNEWKTTNERELKTAKNKRRELQDEARNFDKRTRTEYIDKHYEINRNNEAWIRHLVDNGQTIEDKIEKSKTRIVQLGIEIYGKEEEKKTAIRAWEKFKTIFFKDYKNLDNKVKGYLRDVLNEYGY